MLMSSVPGAGLFFVCGALRPAGILGIAISIGFTVMALT
jgi:hypothetical protein